MADAAFLIHRADVAGKHAVAAGAGHQTEGRALGDWVLIHVGFAMSKIDEAEAQRTLEYLQQIGDAYEQELEQLMASEVT